MAKVTITIELPDCDCGRKIEIGGAPAVSSTGIPAIQFEENASSTDLDRHELTDEMGESEPVEEASTSAVKDAEDYIAEMEKAGEKLTDDEKAEILSVANEEV